jgi:hypothetical protein
MPSTPAAFAAFAMTRSRLRGSTGLPNSLMNTNPLSTDLDPARNRSCFCAALCRRSIATTAGFSGTARRDRSVFGSLNVGLVLDKSAVVSAFGSVNVNVSEHQYFSSDSVAVRCTFRLGQNVLRSNRIGYFTIGGGS